MFCLAKVKFDLRDPDEIYFAQREIDSLLGTKTKFVRTIASLIKEKPFNMLDEEVVHIITRLVYMGEGQGFLAEIPDKEIISIVKRSTFFREIYVIFESENQTEVLKSLLNKFGITVSTEQLKDEKIDPNPYTQIFLKKLSEKNKLVTVRFLPYHTLFEYATEVKKLPAAVFRPKNSENWAEYFKEKEEGIEKGIKELLEHMKIGHYRSPHFGLGKNHIGDFVDWASTDLRKPFLHYLHKFKGKGDPRISRALINLLSVKEGDTILDPFCGSGAFIADAPAMGVNVFGIEILKIGALISKVKCNLDIDLEKLRSRIIDVFEYIQQNIKERSEIDIADRDRRLKTILGNGKGYFNLTRHLRSIIFLKNKIDSIEEEEIREFLLVMLSQKIVEYFEKSRAYDIISDFKSYVEDRYLTLYATRKLGEILSVDFSDKFKIIEGDSTAMDIIKDNSIDGLLTSPPYFDALNYIGNNKASIILLDFDEDLDKEVKGYYNNENQQEQTLVGDEFSLPQYLEKIKDVSTKVLPQTSIELIKMLEEGKRFKKAVVVEGYLRMMHLSFKECYRVLKPSKHYLMVISKYHKWIIKGEERIIDSAKILADIGENAGFKVVDTIDHGLSKADKGKIGVEEILIFQK